MADKGNAVRTIRLATNAAHATPALVTKDQLKKVLAGQSVSDLVEAAGANVTDDAREALVATLRETARETDLVTHALGHTDDAVVRDVLGGHGGQKVRSLLVDVFATGDNGQQNAAATLIGLLTDGSEVFLAAIGVESTSEPKSKKK